jgi:hypothetical protein
MYYSKKNYFNENFLLFPNVKLLTSAKNNIESLKPIWDVKITIFGTGSKNDSKFILHGLQVYFFAVAVTEHLGHNDISW